MLPTTRRNRAWIRRLALGSSLSPGMAERLHALAKEVVLELANTWGYASRTSPDDAAYYLNHVFESTIIFDDCADHEALPDALAAVISDRLRVYSEDTKLILQGCRGRAPFLAMVRTFLPKLLAMTYGLRATLLKGDEELVMVEEEIGSSERSLSPKAFMAKLRANCPPERPLTVVLEFLPRFRYREGVRARHVSEQLQTELQREVERRLRGSQLGHDRALQQLQEEAMQEYRQCDPQVTPEDLVARAESCGFEATGDRVLDFFLASSHLQEQHTLHPDETGWQRRLQAFVESACRHSICGILVKLDYRFPQNTACADWDRHFYDMERLITRSLEIALGTCGSNIKVGLTLDCSTHDPLSGTPGTVSFRFPDRHFFTMRTPSAIHTFTQALRNAMSAWWGDPNVFRPSPTTLKDMTKFQLSIIRCGAETAGQRKMELPRLDGVVQPESHPDKLCTFRCMAMALFPNEAWPGKPLHNAIAQDLACLYFGCKDQDGDPLAPLALGMRPQDLNSSSELKEALRHAAKARGDTPKRGRGRPAKTKELPPAMAASPHCGQCTKQEVELSEEAIQRLSEVCRVNVIIVMLDDDQEWHILLQGFYADDAKDVFLLYTPLEDGEGHFTLVHKLQHLGKSTKCPWCNETLARSGKGRYTQRRGIYERFVENCSDRTSVRASASKCRFLPEGIIAYKPKHPIFEEVYGYQMEVPISVCFDFESLVDPNGIHHPHTVVAKSSPAVAPPLKYVKTKPMNPMALEPDDAPYRLLQWLMDNASRFYKAIYSYAKKVLQANQGLCTCKACHCQECGRNKHHDGAYSVKRHHKDCKLGKLYAELMTLEVPVLGYNSGRYDLTFVLSIITRLSHDPPTMIQNGGILRLTFTVLTKVLGKKVKFVFLDMFRHGGGKLEDFGTRNGCEVGKLPYPYKYMDSAEKFKATALPACCSSSPEAMAVWVSLKTKNMEHYTIAYCERDVDLLLNGIEQYRNRIRTEYGMEVLLYATMPSLVDSLASRSFLTEPLPMIPSQEVYDLLNATTFGGLCEVFMHYAEAEQGYDLIGLDANSLYPWAMTRPALVPISGEQQIIDDPDRLNALHRTFIQTSQTAEARKYAEGLLHSDRPVEEDPYGFEGILVCDLYFTNAQRESLKTLPPLPCRTTVPGTTVEKLLLPLWEQPNYTIPSFALKWLLANDMVTLHRIRKAYPMQLMSGIHADFVEHFTGKRQEAENRIRAGTNVKQDESDKDFNKTIVCSLYGRQLLRQDRYTREVFVRDPKEFRRATRGKTYCSVKQVSSDALLVSVQQITPITVPRYLGMSTLWISKLWMLDFYYNCVRKAYPTEKDLQLVYMDTDSLYMKFATDATPQTPEEALEAFKHRIPTELYERYFAANKHDLTPSKFKIEKHLHEVVCLAPKVRSMVDKQGKETSKAKGLNKDQARRHEDYLEAYHRCTDLVGVNVSFRKTLDADTTPTMRTVEQVKRLRPFDDKRRWISRNESVSHGYYLDCLHDCNKGGPGEACLPGSCMHQECTTACGGLRKAQAWSAETTLKKAWHNWAKLNRLKRYRPEDCHVSPEEIREIAPWEPFRKRLLGLLELHPEFSLMDYGAWTLEHKVSIDTLKRGPLTRERLAGVFGIGNLDLLSREENSSLGGAHRKVDLTGHGGD